MRRHRGLHARGCRTRGNRRRLCGNRWWPLQNVSHALCQVAGTFRTDDQERDDQQGHDEFDNEDPDQWAPARLHCFICILPGMLSQKS
jgi:hypothetical protein